MAICSNCKKEVDALHQFCGYCGASLKPSSDVVIDGRKDKRIKYLINRACHFEKTNILFSFFFLVLAVAGIFAVAINVPEFIENSGKLNSAIWQLRIKYDYMKEGLGLNYLYGEIKFLLDFLSSALLCLTGGIVTLISTYFIVFNSDIILMRHKYRESYSYKKPVRFIKVTFYIAKISFAALVILSAIWILLALLYIVLL